MPLSEREMAGLSAQEREAFDDGEDADVTAMRLLADKLDSISDDDDPAGATGATGTEGATGGEAGTEGAAGGDDKGATGTEGAAAEAGAEGKTEPEVVTPAIVEPFAPKLVTKGVDDYEQQRGSLLDERRSLREKFRSGEISQDTYDEQLDAVNERISRLDTNHAIQQRDAEHNRATTEQQWQYTVQSFKAALKSAGGIDYDTNPAAEAVWDRYVRQLAADDKNSGKGFQWYLSEAHKLAVAEIRKTAQSLGMVIPDAQPNPAAGGTKPKTDAERAAVKQAIDARRPKDTTVAGARPLNTVPNAGGADDGNRGGEFAHLDNLSGIALERAIAAMSPEQQTRYLESQD